MHLLGDAEALRQSVNELGFVYFADLVDLDLIARMRRYVRKECVEYGWVKKGKGNPPRLLAKEGVRLAGRGWDDPNWTEFQRKIIEHPDFTAIISHERLTHAVELVAGQEMTLATAHHCRLKLPNSPEHTSRPHQDSFYLTDSPHMWIVWIPLIDIPLEVGPLACIPGSHAHDWEHIDAMTGIEVPPDVTWATGVLWPGDVVMFSVRTVHCAWSNMSGKQVRASLDIRNEPKNSKPDDV